MQLKKENRKKSNKLCFYCFGALAQDAQAIKLFIGLQTKCFSHKRKKMISTRKMVY